MTRYQLAMYVSFMSTPPGFVIPVFTAPGSNDSFVQDLSAGGLIRKFLRLDVFNFTPVRVLPPICEKGVGDSGLRAYWAEEDVVLFGDEGTLKGLLSRVEYLEASPFAEVERATFLGDSEKLENAAEAASKYLTHPIARDTYHARVKKRVKLLEALRVEDKKTKAVDDEEVSSLISLLQNVEGDEEWLKYWREGWRRFSHDPRLVDIARWRIMTAGLGHSEYSVLLAVRYSGHHAVDQLYSWWLNERSSVQSGWILVWSGIRNAEELFPGEKVVQALGAAFKDRLLARHYWLLLNSWNRCFRMYPEHKGEIIEVVSESVAVRFYKEHFMETVVLPVRYADRRNKWAAERLSEWFLVPKGSSTWLRAFMSEGPSILGERDFDAIGVAWLRRFGKGTNKWFDLFQVVRGGLSDAEAWNIRVGWLKAARKDLGSWVEVFESLADDAGQEDFKELAELARSWQFRGRARRSNSTIEEFAQR